MGKSKLEEICEPIENNLRKLTFVDEKIVKAVAGRHQSEVNKKQAVHYRAAITIQVTDIGKAIDLLSFLTRRQYLGAVSFAPYFKEKVYTLKIDETTGTHSEQEQALITDLHALHHNLNNYLQRNSKFVDEDKLRKYLKEQELRKKSEEK